MRLAPSDNVQVNGVTGLHPPGNSRPTVIFPKRIGNCLTGWWIGGVRFVFEMRFETLSTSNDVPLLLAFRSPHKVHVDKPLDQAESEDQPHSHRKVASQVNVRKKPTSDPDQNSRDY